MAKIRGVVFDLDGTLLDSMPQVVAAFSEAIRPFAQPLDENEWRSRMGGPPERVLNRVLGNPLQAAEALALFHAFVRAHEREVQAFDGMHAMLDQLQVAGLPVAVWTGRDRYTTELLLSAHCIGEKLTAWICGDDLVSHKPDPAGLLAALEKLKISADEAVFVGDAEVDVIAGDAIGVRTIFISQEKEVGVLARTRVWRVASSPSDAYRILKTELSAD